MLCPPEVLARVVALDVAGHSDSVISAVFNREGVPTPAGGSRWQRCHVWRLRKTAGATRLLMFEGVAGGCGWPDLGW